MRQGVSCRRARGITLALVSVLAFVLGRAALAAEATAETVDPQLTLAAAVTRALAANPTLRAATESVARAGALVAQARAGLFPTLSANATYTRLDDERALVSGGTRRVVRGENQVEANLQLVVPLLQPQALERSHRARDARAVAEAQATELRRTVAVATARAYLAIVAQRRVIEVNTRAHATAKAHHTYADTRLRGGLGRGLDEVRAAQELATAEAQLEGARAGLIRAREALGLLVGADGPVDAALDPEAGDVEAATGARATASLDDSLASAAERRLDLQASRIRVRAAEAATADRWTAYAPYLTAIGTPFFQNPASLTAPQLGWQAQLVLSVPLYDGGRRGGVFREQDALVAQARLEQDDRLRQARAEVRAAFASMLAADRALAAARRAATAAQRALELSDLAYRAGATSNIEVVDAERRARDAATAAAVAEDTARLARLELLTASGRFPGPTGPSR